MKIVKNKIKDIVEKYEIRPKKRLGQNFIFDRNILYKIANSLEPFKSFMIVEIGPGPGGLTGVLLEKNPKNILLVEKDIAFKKVLLDLKNQYPKINTQIIFEDFLKLDLEKLRFFKKNKIKFISNLPYYISTQILLKILPFEKNIFEAVFMFQKEVAERLLAKPDNKNYSKLSVIAQYSCDITKIFSLNSSIFYPKPDVDSCLLRFLPKRNIKKEVFFTIKKITKLAFEKRRKTIKNSLSSIKDINEVLKTLKINPQSRAENISVEQYVKLANLAIKEKLI